MVKFIRILFLLVGLLGGNLVFCSVQRPALEQSSAERDGVGVIYVSSDKTAISVVGDEHFCNFFAIFMEHNVRLRILNRLLFDRNSKLVDQNSQLLADNITLLAELENKNTINTGSTEQNKRSTRGLVSIGRLPGQRDSIYGIEAQCLGFKNFVDRSKSLERENRLLKYMVGSTVFAGAAYLGFRAWANKKC